MHNPKPARISVQQAILAAGIVSVAAALFHRFANGDASSPAGVYVAAAGIGAVIGSLLTQWAVQKRKERAVRRAHERS